MPPRARLKSRGLTRAILRYHSSAGATLGAFATAPPSRRQWRPLCLTERWTQTTCCPASKRLRQLAMNTVSKIPLQQPSLLGRWRKPSQSIRPEHGRRTTRPRFFYCLRTFNQSSRAVNASAMRDCVARFKARQQRQREKPRRRRERTSKQRNRAMPKQREGWEKGVGPYSGLRCRSGKWKPDPSADKDISARVVERNSSDDGSKLRPAANDALLRRILAMASSGSNLSQHHGTAPRLWTEEGLVFGY